MNVNADYKEKYGFHDAVKPVHKTKKGLTADTVKEISRIKKEPKWMLNQRLQALDIFQKKTMPPWAPDIDIDMGGMTYYIKPSDVRAHDWKDVPEGIKKTFEKLGVPEAERKFLGGVGAMYESEAVYHSIKKELEKQGVIFIDMDAALKEHETLVRKYFGTVVPQGDNKFAALNSACWSGGSFIYVPPGVKVTMPLQAYFRMNARNMGQFERTLIIADKGSSVHYIEGCSAPIYSTDSLHAAVVEVIALEGAHVRYTTIQNWSKNVYNLVTKRAHAHKNAVVEWVDGNIGSRLSMKYPCVCLKGEGARAEILSIAFAGSGQLQDTGAKVIHMAPNTSSVITSKSISKGGGETMFRGLVRIAKGAHESKAHMKCSALIMDKHSKSDTIPSLIVDEKDVAAGHEATVGKIGEDQLFYLMSRGLSQSDATTLIVNGFLEPFIKELPFEYAIELNRLIQIEMGGRNA